MTFQEHNLNIYRIYKDRIEQDDYYWYSNVIHFRCIKCGNYVTSRTFQFFNKDPKKVVCYKCQGIKL